MKRDQRLVNEIFFQTIYFNIYSKSNISIRISNLLMYPFFLFLINVHRQTFKFLLSYSLRLYSTPPPPPPSPTRNQFIVLLHFEIKKKEEGHMHIWYVCPSIFIHTHTYSKQKTHRHWSHCSDQTLSFCYFSNQQIAKICLQDKFPCHWHWSLSIKWEKNRVWLLRKKKSLSKKKRESVQGFNCLDCHFIYALI